MTAQLALFLNEKLSRVHNATEKWHAQIFLYLALVIIFSVIDRLFVGYFSDYIFLRTSLGSVLGHTYLQYIFLGGNWIPIFSSMLVIVVATRIWTLIGYLLTAAVLTYFLAAPYYFMWGGEARYGHDSFGVAGTVMWWMVVWFWSSVAGLAVKFFMWRRTWPNQRQQSKGAASQLISKDHGVATRK